MTAPLPADHHIDGGDLGCWRLLLVLRDRIAELALPAGAVVHLTTGDPVAPVDLPAWCRLTGHGYLGVVGSLDGRPTYGVRVAADAVPTDARHPWRVAR